MILGLGLDLLRNLIFGSCRLSNSILWCGAIAHGE